MNMRRTLALAALGLCATIQALPAGFYDRPLFSGLSGPTCFTFAPDGRIFIGQKSGAIRIFKNGQLITTPFMNVPCTSNSERGVLGIALDPNFATNRYVYIYYTTSAASLNPPASPKNRVSRFVANGDTVQAGSEEILLDLIPSDAGNHNAGCIRFGLDGKLWITTGDGGQTPAISQNLNSLGGKLLRINSNGSIPDDNPFFGMPNHRSEIWAYGFRNPFRFAFRPGTNVPYLGDVGGTQWEEINVGAIGGNFGWPNAEGMNANPLYINPIYTYPHSGESKSITGGVFANSPRYPSSWANRYVFADYVQDDFYFLDVTGTNTLVQQGSLGSILGPVDFAMSSAGALHYSAIRDGQIRKMTYEPRPVSVGGPASLYGGSTGTGSVTLDVVAPVAGQSVALSSSNASVLSVPATMNVLANSLTGNFNLAAMPVAVDTSVTITASAYSKTASRGFVVKKNGIKGVYSPASMFGGGRIRAYVGLFGPSAGSTTIALSSSNPALQVPSSVVIPNGESSMGFWVDASNVSASTDVVLTATFDGVSKQRTITIQPVDLTNFVVSPNPIVGGNSGTGTVTLRLAAPAGGAVVAVTDNSSLIGTPSSVTVPQGSTEEDFGFTTLDVTVDQIRTISATYRGMTRTVNVTLLR